LALLTSIQNVATAQLNSTTSRCLLEDIKEQHKAWHNAQLLTDRKDHLGRADGLLQALLNRFVQCVHRESAVVLTNNDAFANQPLR
jgi:hypothetical protein